MFFVQDATQTCLCCLRCVSDVARDHIRSCDQHEIIEGFQSQSSFLVWGRQVYSECWTVQSCMAIRLISKSNQIAFYYLPFLLSCSGAIRLRDVLYFVGLSWIELETIPSILELYERYRSMLNHAQRDAGVLVPSSSPRMTREALTSNDGDARRRHYSRLGEFPSVSQTPYHYPSL